MNLRKDSSQSLNSFQALRDVKNRRFVFKTERSEV